MSRFVPLFLALVLALAVGANALHTFPGYRMLQYDQVGTAVGTNKASFNLAGAVASSSSVAGSLAIVNVEALSSSQAIEAVRPFSPVLPLSLPPSSPIFSPFLLPFIFNLKLE